MDRKCARALPRIAKRTASSCPRNQHSESCLFRDRRPTPRSCGYPEMLGPSMRPCGSTSTCKQTSSDHLNSVQKRLSQQCQRGPHDHSDNEEFCNDLKGSKSCKMSEWPLKVFQDFPTSKLNTRVRFPSPAPRFSTPLYDFVRFGAPLNAAEPAPTRAPFSVRVNDTRLRARMRCVALSGRPHGRPARKARPRTLPPSGNVQLHATLVSTPPSKNHTGIDTTESETV